MDTKNSPQNNGTNNKVSTTSFQKNIQTFTPQTVTSPFIWSMFAIILIFVLTSIFFTYTMHTESQREIALVSDRIMQSKKDYLRAAIDRTIGDITNEQRTYHSETRNIVSPEKDLPSASDDDKIQDILKQRAANRIRHTRLKDNGYIWVNEIHDYAGGDGYAVRRVHPNLPQTEGMLLSTAMQDVKGNLPYLRELQGIKKDGELFSIYWFKKFGSERLAPKLTFAKLYKKFDWIIASGVYLDDVEALITTETQKATTAFRQQTAINVAVAFLALLLATGTTLVGKRRIHRIIDHYMAQIKQKEESLKTLNATLENQVQQRTHDLTESEEKLRATLDSIGDGVIVTDIHSHILRMNPVAEHLTGRPLHEALGKPLDEVLPLIDARSGTPIDNPVTKALQSGQTERLTDTPEFIDKNGIAHRIADSCAPIQDDKGTITGTVLVFRDVTQEYRMQNELQKIQKLESIGTLAGGIAHDFNNILMGIFGNIELAKSKISPDHPGYPFIEKTERSMARATHLTNQLRTFAKGGTPVRENVSLEDVLKEIASFDLSGSNIQPLFTRAEDLWPANVDKGQIQQVFSNLTINAKQSMPSGGAIHYTLENMTLEPDNPENLAPGKYIKISVQDEGTGIAQEYLDRIFDPYFTTKQTGSGLGLATVYSIVTRHGGHISVSSQSDKGSTFTLYLPASETPTKKDHECSTPSKKTIGQQARILVMDDEKMIRDVTTSMLNGLGFMAETAFDGKEALEIYQRAMNQGRPFAAVIMDLTIPGGMGGQEAIEKLLQIDPNAKAIVASGYAEDPVMSHFSDYGFKGMASKPYTMEELRQTLHHVLET